ncbi:MAG: aminomethyltransferase family protein [Alphaproteobacteria bacterium]
MTSFTRTVVADFEEPGWDYGIERSPYHELHRANGAKFCVYNCRLMPVSQKIDRLTGYRILRQGVGLFDTGERPTEIVGPDAEALCNKVFARDVSKMKPGRAGYGLLLYPDGGILCDGVLMRLAHDRFWYVQAEGPVYSWLVAHAQGMNVRIRDPKSWVSQVQGPLALDVLAKACDGGAPPNFGYFAVAEASMGGQKVILSRTGWTGEVGFEFYTYPDAGPVDGPRLWRHVLEAGEPFGMKVCGLDSMDIRRIEAGILNNVSDMDETMNPFQAGLGSFIKLDGPDFIGKAALKNADRRPLLKGLRCASGEPLIGAEVCAAEESIGRVTAGAWSPFYQAGVAIIRLSDPEHAARSDIAVRCRDGALHPAEIVELPMYDDEKRIPRGLETSIPELEKVA